MSDAEETEENIIWSCFSCGKHLGDDQQGGGSFDLHFGFGSGFDNIRGINGWVCDECVTQKHSRLRGPKDCLLTEYEETKLQVSELDFFGKRMLNSHPDREGIPQTFTGYRDFKTITSEERSQIEASLFTEKPINRDLIVKLLQALMEARAQAAQSSSDAYWSDINALDRARQQAQSLSAEELAQLRARESKDLTPSEIGALREHVKRRETDFREEGEKNRALRAELKELKVQNAGLLARLER